MPLAGDVEDDEKAKSWTLPSVPVALRKELDAYTLHRTEPLNRLRDGSCVVDITVGSDKATTLRFLGWLAAEREITPGLGVFCRATLSQWAEDYAKALADKGLKYSSVCPGRRVCCTLLSPGVSLHTDRQLPQRPRDGLPVRLPDLRNRRRCARDADHAARRAAAPPRAVRVTGQAAAALLAPRRQLECASPVSPLGCSALHTPRVALAVEWPDAQKARQAAEAAYKALPASPPARKLQALKEWLIICLHTVQPPDRVGIVYAGPLLEHADQPLCSHAPLVLPGVSSASASR